MSALKSVGVPAKLEQKEGITAADLRGNATHAEPILTANFLTGTLVPQGRLPRRPRVKKISSNANPPKPMMSAR
jgi:hypothetical protein